MPPEGIEIVQRSPLREKSGSMQIIKTKEVSSRSPRALKIARYTGGGGGGGGDERSSHDA